MPELKTSTKTTHFVDYSDFDKFVNEAYGFSSTQPFPGSDWVEWPYDFVTVEESSNYSDHTFIAKREEHKEDIDSWVASNGTAFISTHTIFDNLCFRGLVEPGTYVVQVFW